MLSHKFFLKEIVNLSGQNAGVMVTYSIDNEGLNILLIDREVSYHEYGSPVIFTEPKNYRIMRYDFNGKLEFDIIFKNELLNFHHINYLGDGLFLLTCSRSGVVSLSQIADNDYLFEYVKPLDKDRGIYATFNAKIVNSEGQEIDKLLLGDGIENIVIDKKKNIWVGYFDEGIFGNFGWEINDEKIFPIGISGLVGFDLSGRKIWEYDYEKTGVSIIDLYVMNIDENDNLWFDLYDDKLIVARKSGENIDLFRSSYSSVSGIFIKNNHIVFLELEEDEEDEIEAGNDFTIRKSSNFLMSIHDGNIVPVSELEFYILSESKSEVNINDFYETILINSKKVKRKRYRIIPSNGQVIGFELDERFYYTTMDEILQ